MYDMYDMYGNVTCETCADKSGDFDTMGYDWSQAASLWEEINASPRVPQVKRGGVNIQQLHTIADPWQPFGSLRA